MPFAGPETVVDAPALVAPPTGLIQTFRPIEPPTPDNDAGGDARGPLDHWLAGIRFSPENHLIPEVIDPCSTTGTGMSAVVSRKPARLWQPFLAVVHDSCSTWGWTVDDYVGRAQRSLAAKETIAVEQEFMHGALLGNGGYTNGVPATPGAHGGLNPFLSDANAVIYSSGISAPTPREGIALANEAIARSGVGFGVIHMSAFFAEVLQANYAFVKWNDGTLRTINGNLVVIGNGYDGVGPDGTGGPADTSHATEWIYVTDPLEIYREPEANIFPRTLAEATDKPLNAVTYRAERAYAIGWSGLLQVAIKVNVLTT